MKKIEYPSGKRVPFFTFTESLRHRLGARWGLKERESAFSRYQDRLILCGSPRYQANEEKLFIVFRSKVEQRVMSPLYYGIEAAFFISVV